VSHLLAVRTLTAQIVLSPHHRGHRWHRTLTFIALGLSAVVPCGHVVLAKGLEYGRNVMGLDYIIAGGVSYIAGALL
jgi:adiponectin receptor